MKTIYASIFDSLASPKVFLWGMVALAFIFTIMIVTYIIFLVKNKGNDNYKK